MRAFSAVAYYFGRRLQESLKVPVGVIETCWGGTFIEAWISEGAVREYPELLSKLENVKQLALTETDVENNFRKEMERFVAKAKADDEGLDGEKALWAVPEYDDSSWGTIRLPEKIQTLWPSTNGVFWFRKEVEIPKDWAGKDLTLSLGPVDDFDETYFGGELVGRIARCAFIPCVCRGANLISGIFKNKYLRIFIYFSMIFLYGLFDVLYFNVGFTLTYLLFYICFGVIYILARKNLHKTGFLATIIYIF